MLASLYTPTEYVQFSNQMHVVDGIVLAIVGVLFLAQAMGYLNKSWQQYIVPVIALVVGVAELTLIPLSHASQMLFAWQWQTSDPQQQQHVWMGVIFLITSLFAIFGLKFRRKWLQTGLGLGTVIVGVLFLTHPQHGMGEDAVRALWIHRAVGIDLILTGGALTGAFLATVRRKVLLIVAGAGLIISGGLFMVYREPLMTVEDMQNMNHSAVQTQHTYSLNLVEDMTYKVNQPSEIKFDIRDENNKVLKDFDTVHEKQMHLIVVRKDRTNFQHVHPTFDSTNGTFASANFIFPTNGEYRVFADFTAANAQKDETGMKLPSTPYKDVKVGTGNYTPETLGSEKSTSDANGFTTKLSLLGDDTPNPQPYAKLPLTLGVEINKDGMPYKNLQLYLGALGHMVVLGPNLEFVHAHAMTEAKNPTSLIVFMVTFPSPGQYKLYLQTQANDQVNTTDYAYTVKSLPSSNTNTNDSMPSMDHTGH